MRFLSANIALLLLLMISPAQAQPNEVLIANLIRSGAVKAAQQELLRSDPTQADHLFFQALLSKQVRNYDQTARFLHDVLVLNPNHLNARRELTHVLFLAGKYDLAEKHLKELLRIDSNPQTQVLFTRLLTAIHNQKPFGISGHFSFLPSSNVNRGTENLIYDSLSGEFVIDPESRAISGIGAQIGLSGYFRKSIDDTSRNLLTWNLQGAAYEDSFFNNAVGTLQFSHERLLGKTRLSLGPYFRYTWRQDDADNKALGFSATLQKNLTPKDSVRVSLSYEFRDYLYQDYNDGPFTRLALTTYHQTSPSLLFQAGLEMTQSSPRAEHSAYDGFRISGGLTKEWDGGYVTGIGLNAGFREYSGDFPLAGTARADHFFGLSLSLQNNNLNYRGFVPHVSCSYSINQSNIAFYQYNVSECNLGITKRF